MKAASCKGGRSGATVGLGFYGFATAAAAAARAKVCDSGSRSVAVAGILFGVDRRRDATGNQSRARRCHWSGKGTGGHQGCGLQVAPVGTAGGCRSGARACSSCDLVGR